MKGNLIVIEGTDCSGKETQSNMLEENLNKLGHNTKKLYFPKYDTPTGRIVGTCFLGKEELCNKYLREEKGWFKEGSSNVDPLVSSLYYAADRKYNIKEITDLLESGTNVILDRYIYSNLAHQGCKFNSKEERLDFYKKMELLEFNILELPKPDITIFLYVPHEVSYELKKNRVESPDQNEINEEYLIKAEKTYLELSKLYNFKIIECTKDNKIKSKEEISELVLKEISTLI